MKPESLLSRTLRLLRATKLTYRQVADGASVDTEWLAKFKQGHIKEPGVNKVQRVHDFLTSCGVGSRRAVKNATRFMVHNVTRV